MSGSVDWRMACSSRTVTGRFSVKSTASSAAESPVVSRTWVALSTIELIVIPLMFVHADLAKGARLRHARLTDSNQLEEREKGDHGFQPSARVAENGAEVELGLMEQHPPKLLELVGEGNLFHLDRDPPWRWRA